MPSSRTITLQRKDLTVTVTLIHATRTDQQKDAVAGPGFVPAKRLASLAGCRMICAGLRLEILSGPVSPGRQLCEWLDTGPNLSIGAMRLRTKSCSKTAPNGLLICTSWKNISKTYQRQPPNGARVATDPHAKCLIF